MKILVLYHMKRAFKKIPYRRGSQWDARHKESKISLPKRRVSNKVCHRRVPITVLKSLISLKQKNVIIVLKICTFSFILQKKSQKQIDSTCFTTLFSSLQFCVLLSTVAHFQETDLYFIFTIALIYSFPV